MGIESTVKKISEGVSTLMTNQQKYAEDMDKRLGGFETRIGSLEQQFLKKLSSQYGTGKEVPKNAWSWSRFCLGRALGRMKQLAPFEYEECSKWEEHRSKAMEAGNFAAGGSVIPPQYIAELIDFLRPQLITQRLGVRMLTGLTGSPVIYPKLTAGATYYWVQERNAITDSTPTTGNLELQPRKIAALVFLSKELSLLANPSMEATTRADLTMSLAEGIDTAFFQGIGTSVQPVGLINQNPAILTSGVLWATSDVQKLNSLKGARLALANQNALRGRIAWAMNPTSEDAIDKLVTATEKIPYFQTDPAMGFRPTVIGYPKEVSTLVAPTTGAGVKNIAYLGNWDDALIAMWNSIDIETTTQSDTAFKNDELWIKAVAMVDCGVRRNVSFCKVADVE